DGSGPKGISHSAHAPLGRPLARSARSVAGGRSRRSGGQSQGWKSLSDLCSGSHGERGRALRAIRRHGQRGRALRFDVSSARFDGGAASAMSSRLRTMAHRIKRGFASGAGGALRQCDWRFLLPTPPNGTFEHLVVLGAPEGMAETIVRSEIALRVSRIVPEGPAPDALIILRPSAAHLPPRAQVPN